MAVTLITTIQRFIGTSADTKPTGVPPGSLFWEHDTDIESICYDGTNWAVDNAHAFTASTTEDLQQAASTYDLFTATGGNVLVEKVTFTLPNVNCADDVGAITSISVVTDEGVPRILVTTTQGAKANLTANASFSYSTPFTLPVGKKIRLTIAGGASDAPTVCTCTGKYASIVPGGYLA